MATFDGATRSGWVLTSTQYLQQLREKEALKLQKQKAAEERQQVRLQKRQEKEKVKKQGTYTVYMHMLVTASVCLYLRVCIFG